MRPQDSHSLPHSDSRRAAPRGALRLRIVLLATSALVSAALSTTVAHADPVDATWIAAAGTGDFNKAANWDGNAVPDGTATFNKSAAGVVLFTQNTTLGGITVNPNEGNYNFTNKAGLVLDFNGAGLSVGSGSSLTLFNTSITNFVGNSTAGQSHIINTANLTFDQTSTAGSAFIQSSGSITFDKTSNAGSASILSDGRINFNDQANGGTAHILLVDNGVLDISALTSAGTMVGSIEGSGSVFLGSKNLAVGGNDRTTTFDGVIQDGGDAGGTGGSLTKEGTGALTLTGINTYTGATTVNGGALVVDGSIASGVIVNAGGTLAGTGFVSRTEINVGGTLAPGHSDGSFGKLTVNGDLLFHQDPTGATSTYFVQVSPATSTSTTVTGVATLNGATVKANFAPGTYITQKYDILHANAGVVGPFGPLVNTNLSPMFKANLSYGDNDVFLNLSANPGAISGLNTNQRNVSNAIANSFSLTGGAPAAFMTLAPAGLTQISGETAVGTQQATFDAMNQFMGVMLDPTLGGRGGAPTNDAYASMARKAPEAFDARWGVWAAGFGGSQSTSGDAVLGSNKTTSNVFGSAAGAEYRFSPNTVAGFALAGGGTHFSVANGGSGNSDLFQAGAYLRHTQGAAFIAAALAYGWQDVTTNRTVTVAGIDNLRARFNSNAISGRLEGGYKVATQAGVFTPYAAGQFTSYRLPSYTEQAASGANTFALSYTGKDVTATRSELGVRSEKAVALTDATLMLRGRLAWAHDFNTDRNVQATFLTLPGSAFVVNGAQPAADTALTTVSAEMLWRNGWSASATAEAQLSDTTHSYSGKGVVRYNW
jgi:autotransporter-associated beta strand protein